MMKKLLPVLLLLVIGLGACKKNKNNSGCGTQACTTEFVSVVFFFTNKDGSPVAITEAKLVNLRTDKVIKMPPPSPYANTVAGSLVVADDSTKGEFSAEGDEVRLSAKNVETGKVKTVTLKISGGCNCHVSKVSGPDKVAFD